MLSCLFFILIYFGMNNAVSKLTAFKIRCYMPCYINTEDDRKKGPSI